MMRISDSAVLTKYFVPSREGNYDFYRCFACGAIITRQREREVFNWMETDYYLNACPCGSMKYSPGWPTWYEWFRPAVVYYVYKLVLVRGVAAWVDGRFPKLLPIIEYLVRDEWEKPTWQTTK